MRNKPITGYDVARRAGVSQSTVSRALRNDPRVIKETRDEIQALAKEMGYVPHVTARSLITRRSSSIAVVTGDLRNPSFPVLVNTLQDRFARDDYRVLLMSDREQGTLENDILALRGGLVDGVVFISARLDSPIVSEMIGWKIPLVILNRDVDGKSAGRVDRVTSDNLGGGRLVADHLFEMGHRRIGLISGPLANPSVKLRETGFRDALARHGVELDEDLVVRGEVDAKTGLDGGLALLNREDRPTAIFCVTDYVAFGTLDATKRLGLVVPDDVSIVGYNDLDISGWSILDLTTVRQPLEDMAKAAAELLLARIDGAAGPPVHREFGVEWVQRGSSATRITGR
ncbi:LacI family DNA-binding transcriptional regulator [Gordonia rhizosphera]|uniref:Putative LacI family transcriptional regulator n=1 Tax=Gordonia rhizosphera NBRC 16068 TaxID=1108045 RepID=K6VWD9_9ACTN|nr:LacI family DNA-binding transcriptional regulator [Gordonia rhizosphera]GAB91225.1 putative LacI family transcriptional regulator [Gordonia rhizosphera NBRC 16068]